MPKTKEKEAPAVEQVVLRKPDVRVYTGLSDSTRDDLIRAGKFPRPLALGKRAVGWLKSDLDAWLAERIAERDAMAAKEKAA